jgi:hypothetical protein
MLRDFHKGIEWAGINKLLPSLLFILVAAGVLTSYCNWVMAAVITLKDKAKPKITIQVGHAGNKVDTVTFKVPGTSAGNGTQVTGSDVISISLQIRATASNPLTAFLTVNSATPLNNGRGSSIPASKISWTSSDGEIPSGNFAGTSNQLLASYASSVSVSDQLTFYYANDTVYDAGTYTGTVTYTWFVP